MMTESKDSQRAIIILSEDSFSQPNANGRVYSAQAIEKLLRAKRVFPLMVDGQTIGTVRVTEQQPSKDVIGLANLTKDPKQRVLS